MDIANDLAATNSLTGRYTFLRPIQATDYSRLRSIETFGAVLHTYRHASTTPAPEAYPEILWSKALVNLAVCERKGGRVLGVVSCYSADFRNQRAWVSAVTEPGERGPHSFESIRLFFRYLFANFPLRKLHLDVTDVTLVHFKSVLHGLAVCEATFKDDVWFKGDWLDRHVLTIWRSSFLDNDERERAILRPREFSDILRSAGRLTDEDKGVAEFCAGLEAIYSIEDPVPGMRLLDGAFDSLILYEIWLGVEECVGSHVDVAVLESLETVLDLYRFLVAAVGSTSEVGN